MQPRSASIALPAAPDLSQRIVRLQILSIAWMSIEAIVALGAARSAHSSALLRFGGDSAIELFSAVIVLWRFRSKSGSEESERLGARVAAGSLFAVAAFVIASSGLSLLGYREPRPSLLAEGGAVRHREVAGGRRHAAAALGTGSVKSSFAADGCDVESPTS